MILAGDVGGTNTRVGYFDVQGDRIVQTLEDHVPSRERGGLDEIVSSFVRRNHLDVRFAAFGIAGPVKKDRVETTNLPWIIDAAALSKELKVDRVWLLNDLEANAWGVAALQSSDLCTLNPGDPDASGNQAIIAAGTGLGEAGLHFDGKTHVPFATEGGHSDFAPASERALRLCSHLLGKHGHASWERVLSGPGLVEIYEFLGDVEGLKTPAPDPRGEADPAAAIAARALEGGCPVSSLALDLFVEFYGAEAGNLALKLFATGGIFLGGGIAPKILPRLQGPSFLESFLSKGRLRALLEGIPVRVILNDKTALLGAAQCAAVRAALISGVWR